MTTNDVEQPIADVVQLPRRPSEADPPLPPKFNPQCAPAPAPAREKPQRTPPWVRLQLLFAGTSLIDAAPPALLVVWARHVKGAKAWGTRWLRWPRYAWGTVHTWLIAPVCRLAEWGTETFPKLAVTSAVIITTLMWFHII